MIVLSHNYSGLSLRQESATSLQNISVWYREVKSPTGSVCVWLCRWEEIGGSGGDGRGMVSCDNDHITLCGLPVQNPVSSLQHFRDSSADVQTPDIMREFMGGGVLRCDIV